MEVLLSGPDWKFRGFVPHGATVERVFAPEYDWTAWPNATVPGCAQLDLLRNGEIDDPYLDLNSRDAEWVSSRQWAYAKRFSAGEEILGKRIMLRFDGIDYSADIYLNHELIGHHRNLHIPAEFDITGKLNLGDNEIMALIDPAPREPGQAGWTSEVRTCKPRMNYGWDCAARCVPLGLWQHVMLIVSDGARIADCWARTTLSDDLAQGVVSLTTTVNACEPSRVRIEASVAWAGEIIQSGSVVIETAMGEQSVTQVLEVPDPALWWPNGSGDQSLYQARVALADAASGELLDERDVMFGFKRARLTERPATAGDGPGWSLEVNGQRMFAKGWVWAPIDELYSGDNGQRLERMVRLAAQANVNLLRVWGGGTIETSRFYEFCDAHGIMVWQDFPLVGSALDSVPSSEPAYCAEMARTAGAAVTARRSHASHTVWSCGSGLSCGNGEAPAMEALRQAVAELDPDRPCASGTDVCSVTTAGGANFENVERFVKDARLEPVSARNPLYYHRGLTAKLEERVRSAFGEVSDPEEFLRLSQLLQWQDLKLQIESVRRRRPETGGIVPWLFNEPWPNLFGANCVDYYSEPKMAYYAAASAYEPVHVLAVLDPGRAPQDGRFAAAVYIDNLGHAISGCRLSWSVRDVDGTVFSSGGGVTDLRADSVVKMGDAWCRLPDELCGVFVLHLKVADSTGDTLSSNAYILSSAPEPALAGLRSLPETQIKVLGSSHAGAKGGQDLSIEIANTGTACAFFVSAAAVRDVPLGRSADGGRQDVYFRRNCLILPPGERDVIEAFLSKPVSQFAIRGWNTNTEAVP